MSEPQTIWSRDFLLLWQGAIVSALGNQAYHVALVLWTKEATGSGAVVGAVLFASGIANLLMPYGGVLADRFSRVRLLVLLDGLSGLFVLALAAAFLLFPEDFATLVPLVLVLSLLRSSSAAMFHPVTTALVPDLVPAASLNRANSTLQSTVQLVSVVGQGIGGVAYRLLGAPLLLLVDGLSFVASAVSESFIREPSRTRSPRERRSTFAELRDGFRFTGRVRGFRVYLLEATCANFCLSSLFVCLPFFVEDSLGASGDWYGYLLAGMGLGAVLGGLVAAWFPRPGMRRGTIQLVCLVVLNTCMLPLSLVESPWAALAIMVPAWACAAFHGVLLTTLVQHRTPGEIRGRVFGMLSTIRIGLMPLGMAAFGVLVDHPAVGPRTILFWTGTSGFVIALLAVLHPGFRWFFTGDENEVAVDV